MRSLFSACLFLLCAVTVLPAASLKEARLRWLKGNYEEAQADYEELVKVAKFRSPASIGLSKALQSQGEYDKALAVVEMALKALPADADLLARQAELLHLRGRWDEADKAVAAALAVKDSHLLARWVQAQLARDRGEVKKADAEVKGIMRVYGATVNTPDEIKDPDELLIVGLADGRERPLERCRRRVRGHPQGPVRRRPQVRQGVLARRTGSRGSPAGEVQPRRGARRLRQGADHQPQRLRGPRRQGRRGADALRDQGGRAPRRAGR